MVEVEPLLSSSSLHPAVVVIEEKQASLESDRISDLQCGLTLCRRGDQCDRVLLGFGHRLSPVLLCFLDAGHGS